MDIFKCNSEVFALEANEEIHYLFVNISFSLFVDIVLFK